jgi:hypothetical protein
VSKTSIFLTILFGLMTLGFTAEQLHFVNIAIFFVVASMISVIISFFYFRRRRRLCGRIDDFEFRSEAIYRNCFANPDVENYIKQQTQWSNEVDKFLQVESIPERGSFKSARTAQLISLPQDYSTTASNILIQIRGRQEFLKQLKARLQT